MKTIVDVSLLLLYVAPDDFFLHNILVSPKLCSTLLLLVPIYVTAVFHIVCCYPNLNMDHL